MAARSKAPFQSAVPTGYTPSIARLAALLGCEPGVGEKTALRRALWYATHDTKYAADLGACLTKLSTHVSICDLCRNVAERKDDAAEGEALLCVICEDTRRDDTLCVVSTVPTLQAVERSGWRGRYFVLGGMMNSLEGIGADELPTQQLLSLVRPGMDVLLALSFSVDGEATIMSLGRSLREAGASVSTLAAGVPHGLDLEFADQMTMGRAIKGRVPVG